MSGVKWSGFFLFPLALAIFLFSGVNAQVQEDAQVNIDSPASGEALQGVVSISGTSETPGFRIAEVSFAYQSDPTGTWFLIQNSTIPVSDGVLASWDTSTITDGLYLLRVQVFLEDGQVLESLVHGLRVRNYTAVETSTPRAVVTGPQQPTQTPSPLSDYVPVASEPKAMPTNPAQLSQQHIQKSVLQGAGVVLAAALAAGFYMLMRMLFRR
jgi:hypothetical protein